MSVLKKIAGKLLYEEKIILNWIVFKLLISSMVIETAAMDTCDNRNWESKIPWIWNKDYFKFYTYIHIILNILSRFKYLLNII